MLVDEECVYCNGSGVDDSCDECGGNGWVDDAEAGGTQTCPNCDGDNICYHCDGVGYIEVEEDE